MSTSLIDNLDYRAARFLDSRQGAATFAALRAVAESSVPDGFRAYCAETALWYEYNSSNTPDATTGRWRPLPTLTDEITDDETTAPSNKAVSNLFEKKDNCVIIKNNNGYLYISGKKVIISPNGFGIWRNSKVYYVASEDKERDDDYEFDLSSNTQTSEYLVLDTSKLHNPSVRTELSEVVSVKTFVGENDIVIAYKYTGSVVLTGGFNDIFNDSFNDLDNRLTRQIDCVFYPFSDRVFEIKLSPFRIKCSGLNIKSANKFVVEKPLSSIMEDLGQEGDEIQLSSIQALIYSPADSKFKVGLYQSLLPGEVPVIVTGADDITYIHPSLAEFRYTKIEDTVGFYVVKNNNGYINIEGSKVIISPNGFGIWYNRKLYYVASTDLERKDAYEFNLGVSGATSVYLVLDTRELTVPNKRNELSGAVSIKTQIGARDILIGYSYGGETVLLGPFKDVFDLEASLSNQNINDEILFSPEFYAYKCSRYNDSNGVGTGWYNRFSIIHISDTHQYSTQYKEALAVANKKANVIVNTGDDANGVTISSGDLVRSELDKSMNLIEDFNKVPYLQVPGNHDVAGVTKKDYFERICSTVENFVPEISWGDAVNYRTYGYADFDNDKYEGKFRLIMLDPFDYNDGQFESVYQFTAAVFSQKQINWLISTLIEAAQQGLNVITMMHYSFGNSPTFSEEEAFTDNSFYQDVFMIPDIIDTMQHQGTLTRQYPDTKGLNNISVDLDCTQLPALKYVAHLFGHIHSKNHYQCQKHNGKKYDILMLGEAALGTYGNALNKAYRYNNTINNIAFSALHFDVIEQTVYRVSYGSYLNYDKSNSERTTRIPYRFN